MEKEMSQDKIDINPTVTVDALLNSYPELEEVLIGIAPPFKKLKNPMLRRTVAKVATIRHIASVGGVPLNELILKLRKAVGQSEIDELYEDEDYFDKQPSWFAPDKIVISVDESMVKDKDKMTLTVILKKAKSVNNGEIIELITSFLPAPGIDTLKSKGYSAWTKKESNDVIKSYFLKN